jgi:hypothetical protein
MKVGFLVNQLDNRGTGNAVYDYADYNESILGNDSVIFTFREGEHDQEQLQRYLFRFDKVWFPSEIEKKGLDALYHIKSGENDGFGNTLNIPYLVHGVFRTDIHGTVFAAISSWMAQRDNVPYVPHIVSLPDVKDDLRKDIGIPEDAIVFGRHGGFDTFDVPFVWSAINKAMEQNENIWFLFMNTQIPMMNFYDPMRIVDLDPTTNSYQKRAFINSCDAMIHARMRGETFGIAVGEFDICDKFVLTYGGSDERAHMLNLAGNYYVYYNEQELVDALASPIISYPAGGYKVFTPENVMKKFKEVFLDGIVA